MDPVDAGKAVDAAGEAGRTTHAAGAGARGLSHSHRTEQQRLLKRRERRLLRVAGGSTGAIDRGRG